MKFALFIINFVAFKKSIMKRKRVLLALTIFYILLITILSLVNISPKDDSVNVAHLDKVVHFCFYLGLNVLLLLSREVFARVVRFVDGVIITLLTILYSVGIEVAQYFVGRDFDLLDIVANSMGAIAALLLFRWLRLVVSNKVEV